MLSNLGSVAAFNAAAKTFRASSTLGSSAGSLISEEEDAAGLLTYSSKPSLRAFR